MQGSLIRCKVLVDLEDACKAYIHRDHASGYEFDTEFKPERQQLEDAHQTAEFAKQLLNEKRVELCIMTQRRSPDSMFSAPQVTHVLKRFLRFDTWSIPTEQPVNLPGWTYDAWLSSCCQGHLTPLKDSNTEVCTMQVNCSTDWYHNPLGTCYQDEVIAVVATLTHLAKLHLTLPDGRGDFSEIHFEPLTCLTSLRDSALQCLDEPYDDDKWVCCQGVLASNRRTLRDVTLAGPWTVETYDTLQECSKLELLSISISILDVDQAEAFASISADSFRLTLYQQLDADVLVAIKHSQPQIHMLTAWVMCDNEILTLPELLSLQELTVVNTPFTYIGHAAESVMNMDAGIRDHRLITGKALECCPGVTKLTLIDFPGINSKDLSCIIENSLPALQTLSIQATELVSKQLFMSTLINDCTFTVNCDIDCLPHAACIDKAVLSLSTERTMFFPNVVTTGDVGDTEQVVL